MDFLDNKYADLYLEFYEYIKNSIDHHAYKKLSLIKKKESLIFLPAKELFNSSSNIIQKKENFQCSFNTPIFLDQSSDAKKINLTVDGLKLMLINDAFIESGYQVLTSQNYICYDPSATLNLKFIAGYNNCKPIYFHRYNHTYINIRRKEKIDLEKGFLISGRCTSNYFHWLIEYLPKLLWINEHKDLQEVPLLIDANLPNQFYQALQYLMQNLKVNNPIFRVNTNLNLYSVNHLYLSTTPAFIPDCHFTYSIPELSGLNLDLLIQFRSYFTPSRSNSFPDERIYISRKNFPARTIQNEDEIISIVKKYGFKIAYPENLSFLEQIDLFHNAKIIIGSSGAAFANIIFCKENTTIINFLPPLLTEFSAFKNLASISGSRYYIYTGRHTKQRHEFSSDMNFKHSEYTINSQDFEIHLKKLLAEKVF